MSAVARRVTLDSGVTAGDPDSGGDLTGASIEIVSGYTPSDSLNFANQAGYRASSPATR